MKEIYIEGKCFEEDCINVWYDSDGHFCYNDDTEKRMYLTVDNKDIIDKCDKCNIRFENM